MLQTKKAFTMIELIFVIVILGILATVAIPRLMATRTDAVLVKGKSTVASIRSAISIEKGIRLMRGNGGYPEILDDWKEKLHGRITDRIINSVRGKKGHPIVITKYAGT